MRLAGQIPAPAAAPMPVEAPVISTAFPARSEICIILPSIRATTTSTAACTASSMVITEVSRITASSAGRSGASARSMSRLSRSMHFGQNARFVAANLEPTAMGADLRGGGDKEFHLGLGADHRADVTPVQHRPAVGTGKAALKFDQCGAHLRVGRHPRGRLPRFHRAQIVARKIARRQRQRRCHRITALGPDRPVQKPGVQMGKAETARPAPARSCPCPPLPARRWLHKTSCDRSGIICTDARAIRWETNRRFPCASPCFIRHIPR